MPEHSAAPAKPPGAYRVIHTADWHLGKLLGEHSRAEEHRRFLGFLLARVREFSVDALLIAGDVFDSANPPQSAVAQYYDFLSALFRQGGCAVIVIAGNHDSPAHLEAPRQVLRALGAQVIGALPAAPEDWLVPLPSPEAPQLVVAAIPFLRDRDLRTGQSGQSAAEIQRELALGIRRCYEQAAEAAAAWTRRGLPLVATGHLMVAGAAASDSEREIHVGGLGAVSAGCFAEAFAYVALGHLHHAQTAGGRETVRYSGSPIPLSFGEAGARQEVRLLDFAQGKLVQQMALEVPQSRPLVQIRCRPESLETGLMAFQPPKTELPAWIEVVVEDPAPGENLYDHVQKLVEGRDFEVIRVVGQRTTPLPGLSAADQAAAEGIEQLLGDPAKVFAHRLEAEPSLTPEQCTALRTAFDELRSLHAEQQREAVGAARGET
jgi:DNA repair protein SbcD/Mre11